MSDNTSDRAAFEAWAREYSLIIFTGKNEDGQYIDMDCKPSGLEDMWQAWQSARAASVPAEPYGQVTTQMHTGQQFFYRWPNPPYLDNASECVTVYTSPPPVPAGMRLVPMEPTPEMLRAIWKSSGAVLESSCRATWAAVLSAAPPTHPAQAEKKEM